MTMIEKQRIRTGDLVPSLMQTIRQRILAGDLRAGEPVREAVLADELNVSRAPVREALRLLERGGLIEKSPNRSYVVVTFERADLYELATLRVALEVLAARIALQRRGTAAALLAAITVMDQAAAAQDVKAMAAADRRFHEVMVACAEHGKLLAVYRGLQDQIELAMLNVQRQEPNLAEIAARHRRLLAHLDAPEQFIDALKRHIFEGMGVVDMALID